MSSLFLSTAMTSVWAGFYYRSSSATTYWKSLDTFVVHKSFFFSISHFKMVILQKYFVWCEFHWNMLLQAEECMTNCKDMFMLVSWCFPLEKKKWPCYVNNVEKVKRWTHLLCYWHQFFCHESTFSAPNRQWKCFVNLTAQISQNMEVQSLYSFLCRVVIGTDCSFFHLSATSAAHLDFASFSMQIHSSSVHIRLWASVNRFRFLKSLRSALPWRCFRSSSCLNINLIVLKCWACFHPSHGCRKTWSCQHPASL